MPETIQGEFRRVKSRKRKQKPLAGVFDNLGADVYDWTHNDPKLTTDSPPSQSAFDSFKQNIADKITEFNNASAALDNAESVLLSIQETNADDPEWQDLYNRVIAAQSTRDATLNTIAQVQQWIADLKARFGLGVALAIPWSIAGTIAAATALIIALVYSVQQYYNGKFANQVNQENFARAQQGLPPLDFQRIELTTGLQSGIGSVFSGLTDTAKYLLIAAAVIVFLPKMIEGK